MNNKYKDMFKTLSKSYYEGSFENEVSLLLNSAEDKKRLSEVISMLCGVNVSQGPNFIKDLTKAITSYNAGEKIVEKLSSSECLCRSESGTAPCQHACPFNAILKDPITRAASIDLDACTDCGLCIDACEHGNIMDRTEFLPVMSLIKKGSPVIASVAPAIIGQFGKDVSMDQLRAAFMKMGFSDMVETAFFADMLTLNEAAEFDHLVHSKDDLMITSCCCPMWVAMLKRVYKELVKYVSPSVSPMIASGRVLKALSPECRVVFVGPCIAKKAEAKEPDLTGAIDFVLTFEELKEIFDALNINPKDLKGVPSIEYASKGGRLYARSGGVSIAVKEAIKDMFPEKLPLFSSIKADGVPDCKALLNKAMDGLIDADFIEGMGCKGGCVGGPKAIIPTEEGRDAVDSFAASSSYKVAINSDIMLEILRRIGIDSIEDFKNHEKTEIFQRKF